jgi:hypothetical protein
MLSVSKTFNSLLRTNILNRAQATVVDEEVETNTQAGPKNPVTQRFTPSLSSTNFIHLNIISKNSFLKNKSKGILRLHQINFMLQYLDLAGKEFVALLLRTFYLPVFFL